MSDSAHKQRITDELLAAGATKHALHKDESRNLYKIIHEDEHIGGAVNGRSDLGSVMLVATNKRVIFLDHKLFYTTMDELSYDVISGVAFHVQGLFANVTLHSRVGEYNLRFVNVGQARQFTTYLEEKSLETENGYKVQSNSKKANLVARDVPRVTIDKEQQLFLQTHYVGVLSTIGRTGTVCGSVVYYVFDGSRILLLTKSETDKARNILANQDVAFTVYEELSYETLQAKGTASIVTDNDTRDRIFRKITSMRNIEDQVTSSPVTKIHEGSYVIIEVMLTEVKYTKYK